MSVQVEKLENNMAKLTIEVAAEELDKAIEKVYQKQKNSISVPGFRKGKVPRAMVEKMYGAGVFYEDAVNEMIPTAYDKAAVFYFGEFARTNQMLQEEENEQILEVG